MWQAWSCRSAWIRLGLRCREELGPAADPERSGWHIGPDVSVVLCPTDDETPRFFAGFLLALTPQDEENGCRRGTIPGDQGPRRVQLGRVRESRLAILGRCVVVAQGDFALNAVLGHGVYFGSLSGPCQL